MSFMDFRRYNDTSMYYNTKTRSEDGLWAAVAARRSDTEVALSLPSERPNWQDLVEAGMYLPTHSSSVASDSPHRSTMIWNTLDGI